MSSDTPKPKDIITAEALPRYTLTRHAPSPDLAPFVENYWIVRWDIADGQAFTTEILPVPNVNIAVTSEGAEITGVVTGKFSYTLKSQGVVLGVKFLPGGFYPFYKKPMDRLTNQTIPLSDLFTTTRVKKVIAELPGTDQQLINAIEKLLRVKKAEPDETVQSIDHIITDIKTNKKLNTVQAVSEKYQASERTLQHVFQRYVGVGLKWIINRYRLQDVAEAIDNGATNWAALAQEHGFADQAHFIRDFKKIVGETPAQYAKRD